MSIAAYIVCFIVGTLGVLVGAGMGYYTAVRDADRAEVARLRAEADAAALRSEVERLIDEQHHE